MATSYSVKGMTCGGCANSVSNAIKAAVPDATVEVDHENDKVTVEGCDDQAAIAKAVEDAGYEFGGAI